MTYLKLITVTHTIISFVAIVAGLFAVAGLLRPGSFKTWTKIFFVTASIAAISGYAFPFRGITPAQIVGVVALLVLFSVFVAFHRIDTGQPWRWVYAGGTIIGLYLLVFVAVVQSFEKISVLKALAPTGKELPFLAVQGLVLLCFAIVGFVITPRFEPMTLGRLR